MPNKVPFIIYARITVDRANGKREEIKRARERVAHLVYQDLVDNFSAGNVASPGGSGDWGLAADSTSLSTLVNIVAVKPQFGQFPDTVTIVGFYNATPTVPYPQITLIHAGESRTGPAVGAPGWRADLEPTASSRTQVKALKTAIEAAVDSVPIEITKIDINGIIYGQDGYHFPR